MSHRNLPRALPLSRRLALGTGLGAAALALAAPASASGPAPTSGPDPAIGPVPAHPAPAERGARGIRWQDGHVLPTFARADSLLVADPRQLDGFSQLLLITLQGLVNRERPEIYLELEEIDATWVADLPVPTRRVEDPLSLVDTYRERIAGAVVYDMDAPDTINLATTLAGLRGGVAATAELAERHGLEILEDLRGRFADDPAEIYAWAQEALWPQCTHRMLVGLPPTRSVEVEGVTWTEVLRWPEQTRDFSNREVRTVDLSAHLDGGEVFVRLTDAFPEDGWGPDVYHVSVEADGQPLADFVPGTPEEEPHLFDGSGSTVLEGHRFADGGGRFVYRFAVPEGTASMSVSLDVANQFVVSLTGTAPTRIEPFLHFRDLAVSANALVVWLPPSGESGSQFTRLLDALEPGSAFAGWFADDVSGEWSGVTLCSQAGVVVVPADWYANASALSGVAADVHHVPSPRSTEHPEDATAYVTLIFGEGDNIQYCQRHLRALWDDPARGQVPISWTISPLLEDAGPALLRHYRETSTQNDLLVCGPSGAGYSYADSWPQDDLAVYTGLTGGYLARTGLDVVYAYTTPTPEGTHPIMPEPVLEAYARDTRLRGIMQTGDPYEVSAPEAPVPLVAGLSPFGDPASYRDAITAMIEERGGSGPLFIAVHVHAWTFTPTRAVELVESLPEGVRVVLADEFFDLFRRSAGA